MGKKAKCPVTRAQFRHQAQPIEVTINGIPMMAEVKEFSTGSLGWYLNGKSIIKIGNVPTNVQIGMNLTIVGSKDAEEGDDAAAAAQATSQAAPESTTNDDVSEQQPSEADQD